MRWILVLVCGLFGCDQLWGLDKDLKPRPEAGTPMDIAPIDGHPDAAPCPGGENVGTGFFTICVTDQGTKTLSTTFDTSPANLTCAASPDYPDFCLVEGATINVSTTIVTGSRPLVLVATGAVNLMGKLDVSSTKFVTGPGANPGVSSCGLAGMPGARDGGPGGSFNGIGGKGGKAGGAETLSGPPTQPGMVTLRGGCPGRSGDGSTNAGSGGGAVYIAASVFTTTATSEIRANGSGGGGGSGANHGGGGGGGSGGLIVIDALDYMVDASTKIFANGGGGGGGANATTAGNDGTNATVPAMGGNGGNGASGGGNGAPGEPTAPNDGGGAVGATVGAGGGGGSLGYLIAFGPHFTADTSPPIINRQ